MSKPTLETRGLTVRFGGHVAVDAVSCAFEQGTLTAIVGPNGAGKTTYFNLISGQLKASAGTVWLDGQDISRASVASASHRSVSSGTPWQVNSTTTRSLPNSSTSSVSAAPRPRCRSRTRPRRPARGPSAPVPGDSR